MTTGDLTQAKLDLWSIDDFVETIQKEADLLKSKYKERLEKAKAQDAGIHGYFKDIGILRGSTNHPNSRLVLGFMLCNIPADTKSRIKRTITCVRYDPTSNDRGIPVDDQIIFHNNIIVTTDKPTYTNLISRIHDLTILVMCSTDGNVLKTKAYPRSSKNASPTIFFRPKNVLNIKMNGKDGCLTAIENLQKTIYMEYCVRAGIGEFGSRFKHLTPTSDATRNEINPIGDAYYPFNITSESIKAELSQDYIEGIGKRNKRMKIAALTEAIGNPIRDTGEQYTAVGGTLAVAADRYIRMVPKTFTIEIDAIYSTKVVDHILSILMTQPSVVNLPMETLNRLYRIARDNNRHLQAQRNTMVERATPVQKSWEGRVARVNQQYNLNLQYHQLFGSINVLSERVSVLKASVGLGKTRIAIAYVLARGAKYSLMVTEPGNVSELLREFNEQLDMGDIVKVIRKESDLDYLKTFNITSQTTISKVIKPSALATTPDIKISYELISGRGDTNLTVGFNYWAIYNREGVYIDTAQGTGHLISDDMVSSAGDATEALGMMRTVTWGESTYHDTDFLDIMTQQVDVFASVDKDTVADIIVNHILECLPVEASRLLAANASITSITDSATNYSPRFTLVSTCPDHASPIRMRMGSDLIGRLFLFVEAYRAMRGSTRELLSEAYQSISTKYSDNLDCVYAAVGKHIDNYDKVMGDKDTRLFTLSNGDTIPRSATRKDIVTQECLTRITVSLLAACVRCAVISSIEQFIMNKRSIEKYVQDTRADGVKDSYYIVQNMRKTLQLVTVSNILTAATRIARQGITVAALTVYEYHQGATRRKSRAKYRTKTMGTLMSRRFNTVILDECQAYKSMTSSRTIAVTQLRAKNYLFMSATPIANNIAEMLSYMVIGYGPRSLRHMIDVEARSHNKFRAPNRTTRKNYSAVLSKDGLTYEIDITNTIADFAKKGFPSSRNSNMLDRNMTRVLRKDTHIVKHSAWQFDIKEYRMYAVPSPEHMQLYAAQMEIVHEANRDGKYEDSREALSCLMNLIKISEIPHTISEDFSSVLTNKQEMIVQHVKKYLIAGRSVLVFTQFVDMVRLIAGALSKRVTHNVYMLHDKLNPEQRFELIDGFRKQKGNACIVGTVRNLGKGFNLGCADVVIMSDLPWTPLLYEQSVGRMLRPDQKGQPEIFMIMNKYMIDMYKFETIMSKLNMIKKYVDRDTSVSESDTHKVDYKEFLLLLLNRAVQDGVLSMGDSPTQLQTGGI